MNREFIMKIPGVMAQKCPSELGKFSIDSRKISSGDTFIAIKTEQRDGHKYVLESLRKGARCAVVNKSWAHQQTENLPLIIVEDTVRFLGILGKTWKELFSIPTLAITGSAGKTTTRELIRRVLQEKYSVHCTQRNLNNHLGVPLSLLDIRDEHQFSIIEMGANHEGEISYLCDLTKPNYGLITNIGLAHTEGFKDIQGVARAKRELFLALPKEGLAFVNMNDKYSQDIPIGCKKITYGIDVSADFQGKFTKLDEFSRAIFEIEGKHIRMGAIGYGIINNGLAAYAVGKIFDIPVNQIIDTLEGFTGIPGRGQMIWIHNCLFIDDSYNSNPLSAKQAVLSISKMKVKGAKIFVTGDMLELGDFSQKAHEELGELIFAHSIDYTYGFGPESKQTIRILKKRGVKNAFHFSDKEDLIEALMNTIKKGDLVWIKGSRGMAMETILEKVRNW
jgi:UDP-N-acetylmuramoyl-tripeptide--D-alanyl-D-alanine ligase